MTGPAEGTLAAAYGGLVCDLDGVVYRGPVAVPGAVGVLSSLGLPVQYATNNASREPADVAEHLTRLGLTVQASDVATSAEAAAAAVAERFGAGAQVMAVGGRGVSAALVASGLSPQAPGTAADVVAVVQGYGPGITAADLAETAYAVEQGAHWVATNVDLTLPTDRGVAPGNGSLVAAVATAVGHPPHDVVGKPYPALYVLCARRLAQEPGRLLAVGDRLDTDIAGAVSAGLDSLLVLTGVDDVPAVVAAPVGMRPTFLAHDLTALTGMLPVPRLEDGGWRCGQDAGRVVDGRWEASEEGTPDQSLTNRLHAAYVALDSGALSVPAAVALMADLQ